MCSQSDSHMITVTHLALLVKTHEHLRVALRASPDTRLQLNCRTSHFPCYHTLRNFKTDTEKRFQSQTTEWLRLEGTVWRPPGLHLHLSWSWLPRTMSKWLSNTSRNLHRPHPLWATYASFSVTFTVRNCFLMFSQTFLCFSVCSN